MIKYVLGLGSNIGNRMQHLAQAVEELAKIMHNLRYSNIYESRAMLKQGAPSEWNKDYFNMVVIGESDLSPHDLLKQCAHIEQIVGRETKRQKWSPRVIDIDLLLADDLIVENTILNIPHPRMTERDFVMTPLAELEPEGKCPCTGQLFKNITPSSSNIIRNVGSLKK
jgi:2-amino-4-hydroxy-6-hydroxymethyldihydropteridine diphosphokinase